jgi:hypothetical protein
VSTAENPSENNRESLAMRALRSPGKGIGDVREFRIKLPGAAETCGKP